jgi:ubiquinone/menaquinone biosynthesis C-methylase UbiE
VELLNKNKLPIHPLTMNYFSPNTVADRYSRGRPDFHANTIRHIQEYLKLSKPVAQALDIACGTGLSTKALLEIAKQVYGTDISKEMLKRAPLPEKIQYQLASAEKQPFADSSFELITVSSGVHWFNIEAFLQETHRLLKKEGWLVIYENHFIADMEGQSDFTAWFKEVYLKTFSSPPRNNSFDWSDANLGQYHFRMANEETFTNPVQLTKEQLILYFTTQSNIIAAVESGKASYEAVEQWLSEELSSFFPQPDEPMTIHYGNWIKYIKRLTF